MCGAMPVLEQPVQHRIEVVFGDRRELGGLVPTDLSFRGRLSRQRSGIGYRAGGVDTARWMPLSRRSLKPRLSISAHGCAFNRKSATSIPRWPGLRRTCGTSSRRTYLRLCDPIFSAARHDGASTLVMIFIHCDDRVFSASLRCPSWRLPPAAEQPWY